MRAIEYACPECGISVGEMEVYDKHPVTKKPYEPTEEEMRIVIEKMTAEIREPHEDIFATKWWECPLCAKIFNRFQLKRIVWDGTVDDYLEHRNTPFLKE